MSCRALTAIEQDHVGTAPFGIGGIFAAVHAKSLDGSHSGSMPQLGNVGVAFIPVELHQVDCARRNDVDQGNRAAHRQTHLHAISDGDSPDYR